ncbi:hypothetical protein FACS1894211_00670 [Clostridia bacterium]|nr:hypothetical protein FACS1894211_00670 [Clostridia bacterium]
MKKFKLLFSAAVCALALLLFVGCSAGGVKLTGKYDAVVAAYGDTVIANDGGFARLYVNGKAKGDKVFSIERLEITGFATGYYKAEKTASSGYFLMDKDGKVLDTGSSEKLVDIDAYGDPYIGDDRIFRVEVSGFVAELDTTDTNASYAVLGKDGKLTAGRYASLDARGDIFIADNTVKETVSNVEQTVPYYYALKADGTVINAKSKSGIGVAKFENSQKAVAAFAVENPTDNNNYVLYASTGTRIDDAVSNSINVYGEKTLGYQKDVGGSTKTYFLTDGFTPVDYTGFDDEYRYLENDYFVTYKDNKYTVKQETGTYTATYDDFNRLNSGAALVKSGTTKSVVRLDGTVLLGGLSENATVIHFEDHYDGEYVSDKYDLFVQDGTTVKAKACGAEASATLTATQSAGQVVGGVLEIQDSSDNSGKLWIPAKNTSVAITGAGVTSYGSWEGYLSGFQIVKDGKTYNYATPTHNLRYWDGSLTDGNLIALAAGNDIANRDVTKFVNAPSVSFSGESGGIGSLPRQNKYTDPAAVRAALLGSGMVDVAIYVFGASLTYKTDDANAAAVTKGLAVAGSAAPFTKSTVLVLDENYFAGVSNSSVPYFVATNGVGASIVYKVSVKDGAATVEKVIGGLRYAEVNRDSTGHVYIISYTFDGKYDVYDGAGKLLLSGVFEYVAVENGVFAVVTSGSPNGAAYGVIKPDGRGKGKYKTLAKLEFAAINLLPDGSFYAQKSDGDAYYALYDSNGKVIEKEIVGLDFGNVEEYNYNQILSGKKEVIVTQYVVARPNGKSSLLNVTVTEKMLSADYPLYFASQLYAMSILT